MGRPERVHTHPKYPKYGCVAEPSDPATDVSWPPITTSYTSRNTLPSSPESVCESEQKATPPASPLGSIDQRVTSSVRAVFEVRAYTSTLPKDILTPLSTALEELDASIDGKKPPVIISSHAANSIESLAIPESHRRRQAFGILSCDRRANSVRKQSQIIDRDLNPSANNREGREIRGWARLRARAPPPIMVVKEFALERARHERA
ncbi:hypothetical protein H0H81_006171 [Sphagnurus paluster]|uniref:Uncharacterized protein n=1 Tax=Sphagnurus paluster TaxID=117069 RepID=A0A9P7FTI0_9AGAR|nr:hypothetical protein H0H81_006171 [Sphagnurus paluster]